MTLFGSPLVLSRSPLVPGLFDRLSLNTHDYKITVPTEEASLTSGKYFVTLILNVSNIRNV